MSHVLPQACARRALVLALAGTFTSVGCKAGYGGGGGPSAPPGGTVASLTVTSNSLPSGPIPVDFTCDGGDVLPALTWSAPPESARSLVVVIDDPDAPSGLFTHFIAFDVPPDVRQWKEGANPAESGARIGANDFGNVRYNGPCPPHGEQHQYRFSVLASDVKLDLPDGANRQEIDAALEGHLVGQGTLTRLFGH